MPVHLSKENSYPLKQQILCYEYVLHYLQTINISQLSKNDLVRELDNAIICSSLFPRGMNISLQARSLLRY